MSRYDEAMSQLAYINGELARTDRDEPVDHLLARRKDLLRMFPDEQPLPAADTPSVAPFDPHAALYRG